MGDGWWCFLMSYSLFYFLLTSSLSRSSLPSPVQPSSMASHSSERDFLSKQMEALRLRIHALDMEEGLVTTGGDDGANAASSVGAAASSATGVTPPKDASGAGGVQRHGSRPSIVSDGNGNAIAVRARPKVA